MSTRSAIITKTKDGYAGIYCHFDGYETGVGACLLKYYQDAEKVSELIALGDISQLSERVKPVGAHSYDSPEVGTTVAYMRDRGETRCNARFANTVEELEERIGHNGYVYVFEGGTWTLNGQPLAEAVAEAEAEEAKL